MNRRSEPAKLRRRRRFFYAESFAGAYDTTIDMVVPLYRELHRTVVRLAQARQAAVGWSALNILDVGSGTGADAVSLMKALPDSYVVAVDCCAPMHAQFRRAFGRTFPLKRFNQNVSTVTADVVGRGAEPNKLVAALPEHRRSDGFHLAVSCFTLHHLDHREKRKAFQRVFSALAPGGTFILGDLFTYHPTWLAREAHEFDLQWIRTRFDRAIQASRKPGVSAKRLTELRDHWLRHYVVDNNPEPVEPNELGAPAQGSITELLLDVGFRSVAQPFRYWQVGVVVAHKPDSAPQVAHR